MELIATKYKIYIVKVDFESIENLLLLQFHYFHTIFTDMFFE